jgi:CubicO group peptidase (beta-lactamase class C family)
MLRRDFLVETTLSAVGSVVVPAFLRTQSSVAVVDAAGLIADLEKEIPRAMEDTRVPGFSIAVIRDVQLLWRRGFGVKRAESGHRVDHETVFEAGSISKTVFAYAVMKLCERGVIDLDTPLTRYSPPRILSGYVSTDEYERHVADPHDAQAQPLVRKKPTAIDAARYGAAGLLHTTPTDYAKFLIEIVDPRPSDRFRLKKPTIAEMVRPQIRGGDSPASSRALGWEVVHTDQDDVIVHGGDNPGFHAFAAASLQRKTGYIFMTNGDGGVSLLKKLIVGDTTLNRLLM